MRVLGNKELLNNRLAAILNSSQSKTPCGDDPWVINSMAAAKYLVERGYTAVTSLHLNTWEFSVYLIGEHGGAQVIVSPIVGDDEGYDIFYRTADQFRLDRKKTAMVFVEPEAESKKPKSTWFKRDMAVARMVDLLVPVSIRPGGKLEKLLAETGKDILSDFRVDYSKPLAKPPGYDFSKAVFSEESWDHIIHWTRSHHGSWPGESKYDYYRRLANSGSEYPHNAFNTLKNMMIKKKIYASSEKIRKSIGSVGFSDLEPLSMLKWMRWLPKRVNWNFEPYGIAVKKEIAGQLGIRQVIYGNEDTYEQLPENLKPYFQSRGSAAVDWSEENEWRKIGDLDLNDIDEKDLACIVWNRSEASELSNITGARIKTLCP